MIRTLIWAVAALLLAGIVHIVTVIGVPRFAVADPWQEIGAHAAEERFVRLPRAGPGETPLPGFDPATTHAVCRFSLDRGPVRLQADAAEVYWSLSLYDRRGLWVWGVDNRAAEQKPIDILVATDVQVAQLRETLPDELEDVVIVDWPGREGFAIYKILVPTRSLETEVEAVLASARCAVAPIR